MITWHTLDGLVYRIPACWSAFQAGGRVWVRNAFGVFCEARKP